MNKPVRHECVVDTNVPLVANGAATAGRQCVLACAQMLQELMKNGHVVVDEAFRIINEYGNKLNQSGQPGPGDLFFKWVLTNHGNPSRCTRVTLTPLDTDNMDFEEFPADLRQVGFDRSDRKFVAVAAAHGGTASLLQASDSKWWGWRHVLRDVGINVDFLCREEIQRQYEQRHG